MSRTKVVTLNDIPIDRLNEIKDTVPEVRVRIRRQSPRSTWITIAWKEIKPITDFLSGAFEEWLQELAGGGRYLIELYDVNNDEKICPNFNLELAGVPRDPKRQVPSASINQLTPPGTTIYSGVAVPQEAVGVPGIALPRETAPGQLALPPQDMTPKWARGYDAVAQWQAYYDALQTAGRLPQGASIHSDAIAMRTSETFQAREREAAVENARLRERLDAITLEQRKRDESFAREIAALREERAREESKAEITGLETKMESRFEALLARLDRPKESKVDWTAIAGVASAIIPAWLKSQADASARQTEMLMTNQTNMLKAISEKGKGEGEWVKILPFITDSLKTKVDAAIANDENKMMMLKMMGDMMSQQAPDSPWIPLVQGLIEGGAELLTKRAMMMPPPQLAPNAGQRATQPPPQGPQSVQTLNTAESPEAWFALEQEDPQAAQVTKMIMDALPRDTGFHTHEWRLLLFNIHARFSPDDLAPKIVDHLLHCHEYMLLPKPLVNVFDKPEETISEMFTQLPVRQMDSEYTDRLQHLVIEQIHEAISQSQEVQVTQNASIRPSPVVTPAPAPAPTQAGAQVNIFESAQEAAIESEEGEDTFIPEEDSDFEGESVQA